VQTTREIFTCLVKASVRGADKSKDLGENFTRRASKKIMEERRDFFVKIFPKPGSVAQQSGRPCRAPLRANFAKEK